MENDNLKPAWTSATRPTNNSRKGMPNRRTVARWVLGIQIEPEKCLKANIFERVKEAFPQLPKYVSAETLLIMVQVAKGLSGDTFAFDKVMNRAYGLPGQGDDDPILPDDYQDEQEQLDEQPLDEQTIQAVVMGMESKY